MSAIGELEAKSSKQAKSPKLCRATKWWWESRDKRKRKKKSHKRPCFDEVGKNLMLMLVECFRKTHRGALIGWRGRLSARSSERHSRLHYCRLANRRRHIVNKRWDQSVPGHYKGWLETIQFALLSLLSQIIIRVAIILNTIQINFDCSVFF